MDFDLRVAWEDGERIFYRNRRNRTDDPAVLAVLPRSEHPAPLVLERFAHEYALKNQLSSAWAARPLELLREHGHVMLVLEDPGGRPLEELLGAPMEIGRFLPLAINIAAVLGKVHQQGLVHKDLNPANILVDELTGQVRLTGFGMASRL
ncbi:MAG: protein kinase, partial [Bradyrhizobium sp.]|nr:protein kinase [Bradyrhizobium sp.]